jgi:uncharacterized protein
MPWKNGAGTTTEIAVSPAGSGLDEFDWRLAIADLDRSGPFSSFPGVDRMLMLLPPGEVTLEIDGRHEVMAPLDIVAFPGESVVSAHLASGPARDLNLMLRRGRVQATIKPLVLDVEWRLGMTGSLMVLCAIEGSIAWSRRMRGWYLRHSTAPWLRAVRSQCGRWDGRCWP